MGDAAPTSHGWDFWPRWLRAAAVIFGNLLIAAFLTAIGFGGDFAINLLFSQCIGLSIFAALEIGFALLDQRSAMRPLVAMLAVLCGSLIGTALGYWLPGLLRAAGLLDFAAWPDHVAGGDLYWQSVLIGLLFGAVATVYFTAQQRLHDARGALQEQRLRTAEAQREEAWTQLRLLRAQVEPHFLFNSLAHVDSLLADDAASGRALLGELIDYLRGSLRHSRQAQCTLGEELDLLQSYLALMRQRMGERLAVTIDVDEALRAHPLLPMLLQPLVENAIVHGLEPSPRGGRLLIRGRAGSGGRDDGGEHILLQVSDDGVGFDPARRAPGAGSGLDNLNARLRAVYAGRAALELEENRGGGVTARLKLPAATDSTAPSGAAQAQTQGDARPSPAVTTAVAKASR